MNRVTAVLLAGGALLVHMLALYRDESGAFGVPYEAPYAAFRLARNLVHEGVLAWDVRTGAGGLDSYASPLWIAVAALAERLWWSASKFAQIVGVLATLATVAMSTRFDKDRIAGVVPALLLVSCGALAVAGPSGTEWSVVTLLAVTAFVAQEHGRRIALALALALLVAARPEGLALAAVLALQALTARQPRLLVSHLAWVAMAVALELAGARYSDRWIDLATPSGARLDEGAAALLDFTRTTFAPFLLIFPLTALVLGRLSGTGRRALALSLTWTAIVVAAGGGPWALQLAFVPALPLLFIAIEQGIARALDTYIPALEKVAWVAIAFAMGGSVLAGRFPGDLGPLALTPLYERWFTPAATPPEGHPHRIARESLHHEITLTRNAKIVGQFVRDELPPEVSIATAWPGAIGYIAREATVIDLHGRTTPLARTTTAPWWPTWRAPLLEAALALRPDYILPGLVATPLRGRAVDAAQGAGEPLAVPEGTIDSPAVRAALADYELIACPARDAELGSYETVHLLRRRDPGVWPKLALQWQGNGAVAVTLEPPSGGPPLVTRLEVTFEGPFGTLHATGAGGHAAGFAVARTSFVVAPGSTAPLDLGVYPAPPETTAVRARLVLPGSERAAQATVGAPATLTR